MGSPRWFFAGLLGWRLGVLFAIGGLLGMSLYHGAFGFTSAYRRAFLDHDISGVMAQLVVLAAAMVPFAPLLAEGEVLVRRVFGAVAPVGVQVMAGSFLFGLGMQLGGGCGSGTLYTVVGGLAMGYGARIAFGCNIGAFISGVASTSLHGWLWIVFALAGPGPAFVLGRYSDWPAEASLRRQS